VVHSTGRRWRIAPTAVLAAVALVAATAGPALVDPAPVAARTARPATTAQAEAGFWHLVNQARAAHGRGPLVLDPGLEADARAWSQVMAAQDRLAHAPGPAMSGDFDRSVPGWTRGGENVGRGWDVEGLHQAFLASAGHRDNILGDFNRVGVGVTYTGGATWVTFRFAKGPPLAPVGTGPVDGDLWLADAAGRVYAAGSARHHGDVRDLRLNRPVVAMVSTPARQGYWLLGQDGGVFSFGDARFFGSTGGMRLNQPVNGMAVTPSGRGYWLVASDGGVFSFGDARFFGSTGGMRLNQPVNGMAVTPSGRGYWLVASDGGVFAFGDAPFHGSAANTSLGGPTVGLAATPSGAGYWIASATGKVAAFGDAGHHGDASALARRAPIVRIQATSDGRGYWLVAADGTVYPFGSAGSRVSAPLAPGGIVAVASAR
jgi:uncharacterized protein YkwD